MAAYVERFRDPNFLHCDCWEFESDDIPAICEALQTNSTLLSLDLLGSCPGWGELNAREGVQPLLGPGFGDADAVHIANMLRVNTTLTILHLGYDDVQVAGARQLADALVVNTSLTTFGLMGNRIEFPGFAAIMRALKFNSTISTVILGNNRIRFTNTSGMAGIRYIARTLRRNTTLTCLNLLDNPINPDGIAHLATALQINSTMTNLGIRAAEIYALNDRNRHNTHLRIVSLFYILSQHLKTIL